MKFSDRGATIDVHLRLDSCSDVIFARSVSFENQDESTASSGKSATSPRDPNQMVLVTVEDTGIGLSDEAKSVLFHTTQQVRNSGGTGLGLYSLAKRIEALGGKYGVKNRSDGQQGSLFWFTFPYRPDNIRNLQLEIPFGSPLGTPMLGSPMTSPPGSRRPFPRPPAPVIPHLRILLVDDSSAILKITSRFLKANGHTVETADNGHLCLERLTTGRRDFDVLITDLQMPVMDGFTSVRGYRAWENGFMRGSGKGEEGEGKGEGVKKSRLYIIGMSANSDEESVKDALAAGMDDFVMKPFNYEVLAASLKGALLVSSRQLTSDLQGMA